MRELAFQRAEPYVAPGWPDPGRPQQLHLDVHVDDADARRGGSGGARRRSACRADRERGFRVFADPAGHPFCLVYGRPRASDPRWR